ncbi:MAG: aryl-alcohol dehydrogenase [Alphaproteobacteria bacterium]|nr:aryl-alcohol dehydrogenase [Alphaproteobacteria bacterium]
MKIGLGTVQFGLDYGISNSNGKTPPDEVGAILKLAVEKGVRVIDTARLYGESEDVLGSSLPDNHAFDLVTKTVSLRRETISKEDVEAFREGFHVSLEKLEQPQIFGLLAHHADDVLAPGGARLFEVMQDFRSAGLVRKIGASIYDGTQIDFLLDRFDIDLVQLPLNVFDQRLIAGGHLDKLKARGVEIHVRSAFLQGAVFMRPGALPPKLAGLRPALELFHKAVDDCRLSPAALALSFLLGNPHVDSVVCGVNNIRQFHELCTAAEEGNVADKELFDKFAVNDPKLVNPVNW